MKNKQKDKLMLIVQWKMY